MNLCLGPVPARRGSPTASHSTSLRRRLPRCSRVPAFLFGPLEDLNGALNRMPCKKDVNKIFPGRRRRGSRRVVHSSRHLQLGGHGDAGATEDLGLLCRCKHGVRARKERARSLERDHCTGARRHNGTNRRTAGIDHQRCLFNPFSHISAKRKYALTVQFIPMNVRPTSRTGADWSSHWY